MNHNESRETNSEKSLRDILKTYFRFRVPGGTHRQSNRQSESPKGPQILTLLRPIPWILAAVFGFSFYWDFNGVTSNLMGYAVSFEGLLRITSISGLIGFLTNRIAITMLFHPVKRRPLLGQGLIPAHKNRIATRLADSVSADLINAELIREKLQKTQAISRYRSLIATTIVRGTENREFRDEITAWLRQTLNTILQEPEMRRSIAESVSRQVERSVNTNPLDRAALRAYTFIRGRQIGELVDEALRELPDHLFEEQNPVEDYLDRIPSLLSENQQTIDETLTDVIHSLIERLDVRQIVEENVQAYDEGRLEAMIKGVTNEHLLTIQYLGAVLGTIGGFVIWQPLASLLVISTLALTIAGWDHLLHKKGLDRET
ncbi:MAG: DUF445 domain-containing protein [Bacteroidota bacterium]